MNYVWNPEWEQQFETFLHKQMAGSDAAHDLSHIYRVVKNAVLLTEQAGYGDLAVIIPAAWLHDCVVVAKDSPQRPFASRLAAETAVSFLNSINYPAEYHEAIAHAVAAHSFSANIPCETVEAQLVQDADRLDSLGAIGIVRCLQTGVAMNRRLYATEDPFCHHRQPNDETATIDHFYTKLFTLAGTMKTKAGRAEAERRTAVMREWLGELEKEIWG